MHTVTKGGQMNEFSIVTKSRNGFKRLCIFLFGSVSKHVLVMLKHIV